MKICFYPSAVAVNSSNVNSTFFFFYILFYVCKLCVNDLLRFSFFLFLLLDIVGLSVELTLFFFSSLLPYSYQETSECLAVLQINRCNLKCRFLLILTHRVSLSNLRRIMHVKKKAIKYLLIGPFISC